MSTDADKNLDDAANATDSELIREPKESGDKKTESDDVCEETKKTARSVRFPDDDQLVTQYFEPANPWQDVPTITRAQLAAEYLEACRKHNTSCIDCVLQQIRDLPESCMGGATRAPRLILSEASLAGAAPVDALEAVLRRVQFRRLELDHSALDDEGAEALFDMVEYYESATVLCIGGPRGYGIRGWQAVSRMIKKSAELSELEVSDGPLEPAHAPVLARALKPHTCRLRALTLQRAALAGEPLLCLVIALKSNSSIRELRLGDNRLCATDAAQVASLLRYNTHIQLLDLSNNQIQDAGVAHIAEALVEQAAHTPPSAAASPLSPHNCLLSGYEARGLAFLILWNNQLSRNCCVHLGKALRLSKSLCVLNVGHNPLGADAVRMRLDLRDNRLGLAGLQALATAMQHNTNLTQIDLDEPPESSSLSAEDSEAAQCRRLRAEVVALCRRNECPPSRNGLDHHHPLHRKISLTCHTACLLRGLAADEERKPRLRSPLPSPAPSPAGSPVPAAHSRFSVTRVTPERESSSDSCPSTPTRPTFCPTSSRFKVVQVMEPPQIQVHPATSQSRKSPSRFSVTRNYDSVYNPTPTNSPPPPSVALHSHAGHVELKTAAKVTTDVKTDDAIAKVSVNVVKDDKEVLNVDETRSKGIEFDAKHAVSVKSEAAVNVDVIKEVKAPVKVDGRNKVAAPKDSAKTGVEVVEGDEVKMVAEATSVVAIDIKKPNEIAIESNSNVSDKVIVATDNAKTVNIASEAKAAIASNKDTATDIKAAFKAADSTANSAPHKIEPKSIRELNEELVEASVNKADVKDDRSIEKPSLHSVMTQTSLTETKREVRPTIIPDKRMEIKTVTAAAVKPLITDAKLERNIPIVAVTVAKDLDERSNENTQIGKSENRIKCCEDNSDVKTDSDIHVIEDSINLVKSDLKYSDVVKAVVDKTENISHDEKIECGVLKTETKLQKCCVEVSGTEKLDIGIEVTVRKETKVPCEQKDSAMKQIVAITEDLGNIIQEMKDFTHKKCIIVPANIRDSVVLKKNKSESSLDSPDLEVSRLMNKKLIGSPFDSNSSLEISGSSMESLNEKPTIQGPEELDRRKVNQVTFSTASSLESASDATPVNTGNLLNLSVSSNESVSPIFGRFKKIHDSLSSLEASVSSLDSAKHEKVMVTSADSGIEYSLQHPAESKEDNSSNEGTLTNNSSLKDTMSRKEGFQLLDNLTSSPKRTSSLLDMPALKNKSLDRMRKISWVAPSSSFHIPRQEDRDAKPSHLEKLLSIFQHPSSIFSRSTDEPKLSNTPPRKDSTLTSSFWSWGSTVEREREEDSSEATDSTLSERVQVSFVDESFSKRLDSKTPSTDTDNTLSEFQTLQDSENDSVTKTTEENIVQSLELRDNSCKEKVSVDIRPNDKVELEREARPRSFAAVLKSGSENSLDRQTSPESGQPVDKLPSKVIRGIKENISPENTLTSSMSNTRALAYELEKEVLKNEPKSEDTKDLAPIATIDVDDMPIAYIDDGKDKLDEARNETEVIDLGKDALSYLVYENKEFGPRNLEHTVESSLAQELKDAEIKEMLDLSPELIVDESLDVFPGREVSSRTSPVVPERAKIKKANSLEDLKQLLGETNSPKVKTIAFKVPESTRPRDIPERRTKLRTRSGSSPKSLPESLNKPCPLSKMDLMISKKKKVSSLGKMARDSLLALNMTEDEIAEFRKSYKLTSVESLRSLESVSEDANSQSGNSVDSRCRSCLRTSQESLMSLDSITEDCKCGESSERPGKSTR